MVMLVLRYDGYFESITQDLAELLELVSKPLPVNHWSPTMVTADAATRKTIRNNTSEGRGNSQLDKAIARMQMIAAAKNA